MGPHWGQPAFMVEKGNGYIVNLATETNAVPNEIAERVLTAHQFNSFQGSFLCEGCTQTWATEC